MCGKKAALYVTPLHSLLPLSVSAEFQRLLEWTKLGNICEIRLAGRFVSSPARQTGELQVVTVATLGLEEEIASVGIVQ